MNMVERGFVTMTFESHSQDKVVVNHTVDFSSSFDFLTLKEMYTQKNLEL